MGGFTSGSEALDWKRKSLRTSREKVVETTVEAKLTAVPNTAAIKLELPENTDEFEIVHNTASEVVWIGPNSSITAGAAGTYPLFPEKPFRIKLRRGNANELYAISSSGTISTYAIGTFKE